MSARLRAHSTFFLVLSLHRASLVGRWGLDRKSLCPANTERGLSQREKHEIMEAAREHIGALPRRSPLSCAQAKAEFGFDQTLSREPKQTIAGPLPRPGHYHCTW